MNSRVTLATNTLGHQGCFPIISSISTPFKTGRSPVTPSADCTASSASLQESCSNVRPGDGDMPQCWQSYSMLYLLSSSIFLYQEAEYEMMEQVSTSPHHPLLSSWHIHITLSQSDWHLHNTSLAASVASTFRAWLRASLNILSLPTKG